MFTLLCRMRGLSVVQAAALRWRCRPRSWRRTPGFAHERDILLTEKAVLVAELGDDGGLGDSGRDGEGNGDGDS